MQNIVVNDIVMAVNGELLCGDGNIVVDTISTDSNNITENCLFVPIIGERVDAHRFIDGAINNGAVACLTSEHDVMKSEIPYIRVTNTTMALQELGKYYEKIVNIPKIGITGSVGKTTTKEMVACALSAGFNVFKTAGNNNSQIGVPLTLLKMSTEDEIAVIEMGMSMKGEMQRLAELVTLNDAVITNIGVSHIEQLKTQDGICMEKFHIADAIVGNGTVFLNGDDEILLKHRHEIKKKTVLFGMGDNCDYRATNIKNDNGGMYFEIVFPDEEKYPVKLNVPGIHNVRNALVAIAVACKYGVAPQKAIAALSEYKGVAMRQQISVVNNITIIDDSYNASPDSMKAGIDVLCSTKVNGRHIAVLADMLELGPDSPKFHYEIGKYIGNRLDIVIVYGEYAKMIGKGCEDENAHQVIYLDSLEKINEYLSQELMAGDAVLFKGSRGMKLNECADELSKHN